MVSRKEVGQRLARVGLKPTFWVRPEIHELAQSIMPDEEIRAAVSGRYEGGFALLVATDQRLLLIDKKPFFLNLEDMRYDMVSEVEFTAKFMDATVRITTVNKHLSFTSFKQKELRHMTGLVQQRIMELKQYTSMQRPEVTPAMPYTPEPTQSYLMPSTNYPGPSPAISSFHKPASGFPPTSLSIRRRVSRFYPSNS